MYTRARTHVADDGSYDSKQSDAWSQVSVLSQFHTGYPPLSAPVAQPMTSTPACGSPVRRSISICRAAWSLKLRASGTQSHPPSLVRSLSTYPCLYLSHSHALCCVDSHARALNLNLTLIVCLHSSIADGRGYD